jgi:hypothetical protein
MMALECIRDVIAAIYCSPWNIIELQLYLQAVDASVGFDIEVKMATPPELAVTPQAEVDRMVVPILQAIQSVATFSSRPIVFSSFDPEICR